MKNLNDLEDYFVKSNILPDNVWKGYLFNFFSNKENLKLFLQNIIIDDNAIKKISKNSLKHVLGFEKIVLIDHKEYGYMFRIHIWKDENINKSLNTIHIHNHWCDFHSIVIAGEIGFSIFHESSEGELFLKYKNPLQNNIYYYEFVEECKLEHLLTVEMNAYSHYFINQPTLHYLTAKKGNFTATIVLQSPNKVKTSLIYTKEPIKTKKANLPLTYNTYDLKQILEELIIELDKQ